MTSGWSAVQSGNCLARSMVVPSSNTTEFLITWGGKDAGTVSHGGIAGGRKDPGSHASAILFADIPQDLAGAGFSVPIHQPSHRLPRHILDHQPHLSPARQGENIMVPVVFEGNFSRCPKFSSSLGLRFRLPGSPLSSFLLAPTWARPDSQSLAEGKFCCPEARIANLALFYICASRFVHPGNNCDLKTVTLS